MKIILAGGSGQVGTMLSRALAGGGNEVVVLSRQPRRSSGGRRGVHWDGKTIGPWANEVNGADVVINLAGRSVNCRYNEQHKREIVDSRVDSTRVIGEAIARSTRPPRVWLQAGTATVYSHRYDAPNDEISGIIGGSEPGVPKLWKFSVDVGLAWERALAEAKTPATRKVALRTSLVMSPDPKGVFDVLLGLVRAGLGGRQGDGQQFVSWIHSEDFVNAVEWLIRSESMEGPVNIASPKPLPNGEFMRELRRAAGVRFGLPASRWMLEVGAVFLRTETELILKSRRVVPRRLLEAGFVFKFPEWPGAARDLCAAWRIQAESRARS